MSPVPAPAPSLTVVAAVAAVVALVATAALLRLAPRLRLVRTDEQPRIGGLAIAVALAVVALIAPEARDAAVLLPALAGLALGLHDDLTDSPALLRLLALVGIASGAWFLGARVETVVFAGGDPIALGAFSAPVSVLWILVVVVGFDFIDGLDGLAASLGLLAAVALLLLGVSASLGIAVIAALATFLLAANRPPARAWLGDAGSNGLGVLVATLALSAPGPATAPTLLLIFAVPILDAGLTVIRRLRGDGGLLQGELGHLHHRLERLWGSPAMAVAELVGVATLCTTSGLLLALAPDRRGQALIGAVIAIGLLLWRTGWLSRPGGPGTR